MKKYASYIFIALTLILGSTFQVAAQTVCTDLANTIPAGCSPNKGACDYSTVGDNPNDPTTADNQPCVQTSGTSSTNNLNSYTLLAPLPCPDGVMASNCTNGQLTNLDTTGNASLGVYLNIMIRIIIGVAAVLAMIMIVMGGIQYMTSDFISSKEEGKHRIKDAIFGLILAVGAYLILNTINPDLLKSDFASLTNQDVSVVVGGESTAAFSPINQTALQALGVTCTGSGGTAALVADAESFQGKVNYSQAAGVKNVLTNGVINTDCSGYVDQVYACAGLSNPGGNTTGIFSSGAQAVTNISTDGKTVNGQTLQPGDLLGWTPSQDPGGNGHVVMYIGNGQIIDNTPSGVSIRSLTVYSSRIKYVKSSGAVGSTF